MTRQTYHGELAALLCEAWYVVLLAPGGPHQGADAGSPDHVDGDLVLLHGLDDPQVAQPSTTRGRGPGLHHSVATYGRAMGLASVCNTFRIST